jgi:predicted nucleotidyltransferase
MIQPIISEKLPQVKQILREHRVKRAHVFGSVCTDRFTVDSDIDLLVSFKKIPFGEYAENFWSLEESLKNLFEREVDIVVEKNLRNPFFIKVMNQTKTPIYE